MKAVFLDHGKINLDDLTWEPIEKLCDFTTYAFTEEAQLEERIADAEVIFMDGFTIDSHVMDMAPKLKILITAATGYNNIDIVEAEKRGIAVANVPAYSTDAVSQHAMSLLLGLTGKLSQFDGYSKAWAAGQTDQPMPEFYKGNQLMLLAGKSIGIVGYGNIGRKMAKIAEALGMTVNVYSQDKEAAIASDVVSLHCPLTAENEGMVNEEFISKMKDGAILINTARGRLVDEQALAGALKSGKLAGAGLDVTAVEPLGKTSPLAECDNCIITPHIAFMPKETRQSLIDISADNLKSFMEGGRLNRIV